MSQSGERGIGAAQRRDRRQRQRRPGESELAIMVMPEARKGERAERDGEENADERQRPRPR